MTFEELKLEEKVNLSIGMVDACIQICTDALRDQDKAMRGEELLEEVRARIMYKRRRHHEV